MLMKKLESLKKAELIEIILRKDEVEKELRQKIKDLEFDVDQVVGHCEEVQGQLDTALANYENSYKEGVRFCEEVEYLTKQLHNAKKELCQSIDDKDKILKSCKTTILQLEEEVEFQKKASVGLALLAAIATIGMIAYYWFL